MKPRSIDQVLAGLLVLTFVVGAFGAAAGSASEGNASGRATDQEENGDWNSAVPITSGDFVLGSLYITSGFDNDDWYRLDVPNGKVLNANLYMVDYNTSNIGQYNFHLELYSSSNNLVDESSTLYRTECVMVVQNWYPSPVSLGIRVVANRTGGGQPRTDPGHYNLSVSVGDVILHTGSSTGILDEKGPVGAVVLRLNPGPADDHLMKAMLRCPVTGAFSVSAYNVWPLTGSTYLLNASLVPATGYTQTIYFGGYNGTCYIYIKTISGFGTYNLTTSGAGLSRDNNNIPEKATLVNDNQPRNEFADQGVDWVDWYKVNAKANRQIDSIQVLLDGSNFQADSTFRFAVYDQNLAQIGNSQDVPYWTGGGNGHWVYHIEVINLTVAYNGPIYFSFRAISYNGNQGASFIMARGWYFLTFVLPNDRPVLNGTPPDVHMSEDTTDESTVLAPFCSDPDGDTLTYSIYGSSYPNTSPKVNSTTGRVTFTPKKDWSGVEKVRFHATDNGPGNKAVELSLTVYVDPVNDPPVLVGTLPNLTVLEENSIQTADVSALVTDIDTGDKQNITYSLRAVSADTRPPGASLDTSYDPLTHTYKLGPAMGFFGSFMYELTMSDNHPGTEPLAVRFNLTINHRNHDPVLRSEVVNPTVLELKEDETNSLLVISSFFTDPDLAADYANDMLKYSISVAKRLDVNLSSDGRITVNTGKEEYFPGPAYEETLTLTAKDLAGRAVNLNLTVRVMPLNDPPIINTYLPDKEEMTLTEGRKEVFRITASDNDTVDLVYTWLLDDVRQKETGSVYNFVPDYTMAGPHTLKVTVSDGATTIETDWKVTVTDVNRLPVVNILSPINSTKFMKGTTVTFRASGSDPDGETLSFTWRDETGAVLGTIENLTINSLQPGTRIITVEANDGKGSSYQQVTVAITKPATSAPSGGGFIPGFELVVVIAGIGICMAAARLRRWRPGV
jgi:hypothetical protein